MPHESFPHEQTRIPSRIPFLSDHPKKPTPGYIVPKNSPLPRQVYLTNHHTIPANEGLESPPNVAPPSSQNSIPSAGHPESDSRNRSKPPTSCNAVTDWNKPHQTSPLSASPSPSLPLRGKNRPRQHPNSRNTFPE